MRNDEAREGLIVSSTHKNSLVRTTGLRPLAAARARAATPYDFGALEYGAVRDRIFADPFDVGGYPARSPQD